MTTQNALVFDAEVFSPSAISEDTHAFNQKLIKIMSSGPKWYEVGAPKYRQMRAAGETALPAATHLETAEDFTIPSRDNGRKIPCRILRPQNSESINGVFMHIHGGGWVLQDEKSQDPALQSIANNTGVLVISIGYRLAPEDPFPAGPNDCYDAAEWLVDHAESTFGAPLTFTGGESSGAHLSMLVALYLLQSKEEKYSSFNFKGLLLHFGVYDLTWTPSVSNYRKKAILVLDKDLMEAYVQVFLPKTMTMQDKKHPSVSPLYADLEPLRGRLPPALFTCGTEDCVLDDTIFMSSKWLMAGGETLVKIVPGVPHGYIMFPRDMKGSGADVGLDAVEGFIHDKVGAR